MGLITSFDWKIKDEPIMQSSMDLDTYKITMGQLIFAHHPNVPILSGLLNRTKSVNLVDHISKEELKEQLDHARTLRFTNSELHYLRGMNEYKDRMFSEDYLQYLKSYQLPSYELSYKKRNLSLGFPGKWTKSTYWETVGLSIIAELFTRSQVRKLSQKERNAIISKGLRKLYRKIKLLKQYPGITISDFTTRRRAFREWHELVVSILKAELPGQFLGTSNLKIAMDQDLLAMGTNAHELQMVYSRLFGTSDEAIRYSPQRLNMDWWNMYGEALALHLPDTFGTDAYLRDMSFEAALRSKGFRQDSGDPIAFGEKVISFYKRYGIDPREKMIVFSDGLDVETIIKIYLHFEGRIKTTYGWGTNLGNDLGLQVLSIVIKILMANGLPTVKLPDNLSKAMGPIETQEEYKRIFDYHTTFMQECKY